MEKTRIDLDRKRMLLARKVIDHELVNDLASAYRGKRMRDGIRDMEMAEMPEEVAERFYDTVGEHADEVRNELHELIEKTAACGCGCGQACPCMKERVASRYVSAVSREKIKELEYESEREDDQAREHLGHDAQMLNDAAEIAEKSGESEKAVGFLRDMARQVLRGRPITSLSGPQQKWLQGLLSRWGKKVPDLQAIRKRDEQARLEAERAKLEAERTRLEAEKAEDLDLQTLRDIRDLQTTGWKRVPVDDFALEYEEADYVAEIDGEPKWAHYTLSVKREGRLLLTRKGSDPDVLGRIGVGFIVKTLIEDATKLLRACEERENSEGAEFAKRVLTMLKQKKRLPEKYEQGFLRGLAKLGLRGSA